MVIINDLKGKAMGKVLNFPSPDVSAQEMAEIDKLGGMALSTPEIADLLEYLKRHDIITCNKADIKKHGYFINISFEREE